VTDGILLQMSSPDDHRSSNGKGVKYQSALNMLAMLLPGATLSYYGEEIGLLEMDPDDDNVAKYTSQLGRAVCCDETVVIFYMKCNRLLLLFALITPFLSRSGRLEKVLLCIEL